MLTIGKCQMLIGLLYIILYGSLLCLLNGLMCLWIGNLKLIMVLVRYGGLWDRLLGITLVTALWCLLVGCICLLGLKLLRGIRLNLKVGRNVKVGDFGWIGMWICLCWCDRKLVKCARNDLNVVNLLSNVLILLISFDCYWGVNIITRTEDFDGIGYWYCTCVGGISW